MNRHIGVGDSKNEIVFDPLLTGHVIWRMRRHPDIAIAFNTGPYTILADNLMYLDRRAEGVA